LAYSFRVRHRPQAGGETAGGQPRIGNPPTALRFDIARMTGILPPDGPQGRSPSAQGHRQHPRAVTATASRTVDHQVRCEDWSGLEAAFATQKHHLGHRGRGDQGRFVRCRRRRCRAFNPVLAQRRARNRGSRKSCLGHISSAASPSSITEAETVVDRRVIAKKANARQTEAF